MISAHELLFVLYPTLFVIISVFIYCVSYSHCKRSPHCLSLPTVDELPTSPSSIIYCFSISHSLNLLKTAFLPSSNVLPGIAGTVTKLSWGIITGDHTTSLPALTESPIIPSSPSAT